jgi:peptidoglycan/LPS O-acetylase OafA/YrhL
MDLSLTTITKAFAGALGVHVFFILSGYLIWRSAQALPGVEGARVYAIHRITRLVPLYWLNLAFCVLVLPYTISAFQPTITSESILRHLTFTQSLLPSVQRDLNPVLWTLTHEAIFYALVPLMMMLPKLAIPALGLITYLWPADASGPFQPFLALFFLFTIGIMFAERRFVLGLVVAALVTGASWSRLPLWQALLVPSAALTVFVGLQLPNQGLRLTAPLRWVGVLSYSLYIWHYLLINIIGTEQGLRVLAKLTFGASSGSGFVRAIAFLTLTFFVCWLSYRLIERPSMNQLRRYLTARGRKPVIAASTA